jgi:hypothetical protein
MEMSSTNKVSPIGMTSERHLEKIACCLGCCGIFRINGFNHISENRNFCCWICGFCQSLTFNIDNSNTTITSKNSDLYCGCCFCWDSDSNALCCFIPLNK